MGINYEVKHQIPGRIRLAVPAVSKTEEAARACARLLRKQEGVTEVRVNRACASIIINYDINKPEVRARLERAMRAASISKLVSAQPAPQNGNGKVDKIDFQKQDRPE